MIILLILLGLFILLFIISLCFDIHNSKPLSFYIDRLPYKKDK